MAAISCPFCGSNDTDRPYSRPSRIFILSSIFRRLRLWYCPPHAAAFDMLEVLRVNLDALDSVIKHVPAERSEVCSALDAEMRGRTVVRRATAGV